jgi:hypothetical protein
MAHYGLWIGWGLLAVVTVWAFLLAKKATNGVAQFREEHHQRFRGNRQP